MANSTDRGEADDLARAYARRVARRDQAVLQAEVRLLVRALAPFGVMSRRSLARSAHAERWHGGSFDAALQAAIAAGVIERLPSDPNYCRAPRGAAGTP
jgi:hypothetical protein